MKDYLLNKNIGLIDLNEIELNAFEIENDIITHCQFTNGCRGNTQGLAKMVEGQNAKDVMNRLRGIQCRGNTSCPDQLSRAIEQYYQQHAE